MEWVIAILLIAFVVAVIVIYELGGKLDRERAAYLDAFSNWETAAREAAEQREQTRVQRHRAERKAVAAESLGRQLDSCRRNVDGLTAAAALSDERAGELAGAQRALEDCRADRLGLIERITELDGSAAALPKMRMVADVPDEAYAALKAAVLDARGEVLRAERVK